MSIFAIVVCALLFRCVIYAEDRFLPMQLEAILIWGTNDEQSPDPNHKPLEPSIEAKLRSQPFKWKKYFEVNRQSTNLVAKAAAKLKMSQECEIEVLNRGDSTVEVTLIGKGQRVGTVVQPLPPGELLILGGNAPNMTGWFVVIRQRGKDSQ